MSLDDYKTEAELTAQLAIAREALEAIGRKAAVQCVVCNRLASFCDSEPVREKFQCTGRMARRALARLDAASPAEPKYPCGCCGALRMKGQGVTTFTVCDHCYDNCMHGRPHVPESPAEKPAQIPVASPSGRASETLAPPGGGETGGIYTPAGPPVALRPARTAREVAHNQFTTGRIPAVGEPIAWCGFGRGGDIHSSFCDATTAAIEADRKARP